MHTFVSLFWAILLLRLLPIQGTVRKGQAEDETCVEACRAMMSCEAYSPQTCLALEELLGCSCPACSLDCHRRLNENATAPTIGCLGELSCDDSFAALGVTCAFLEDAVVNFGAPESCDCSSSICAQDDETTFSAPENAVCTQYVENHLEARPCVALTRPATDAVAVKEGDALSVDGRLHRWTSSGRRPVTIEAGATLEVMSVTIDGSSSTEYFAGCVFVGAGSRFSATATTFVECQIEVSCTSSWYEITSAQAVAAGGAIAAWTGSEVFIQESVLEAPRAKFGGGIFLYASADAIVEDSRISLATAELRGACAYIEESATLAFSGSHCNDCTAQEGGGFYTQPGSILQVTKSLVEGGFANGGAVLLAYGAVYSANSTFRDSFASTYCGGLMILGSSASFVGEDLVLRALSSANYAAAVLCAGFGNEPPTVLMRRVAVEKCNSLWAGSITVYAGILNCDQVVITQSRGFSVEDSTATIIRSIIANCTATIHGGCVSTTSSDVTISESQLKGCAAPRGGAICAIRESRLALRTVVITDSVATEGSGGAASCEGSSVLDAGAVIFANCTAADDGGAVSVIENSRVSLGGETMLEGNVATGSGGAISVRASELYVAPRCTFVVLSSVEITRVLTLDFSNGGADYTNVARAWLLKSERHGPEAYFDARGVLAEVLPEAGTRKSLELCLEPATYEVWTVSYLGEAWRDVNWELATHFGDVRDYMETRFSGVGHPGLVHGLQAATFKIMGDAEEQHRLHFTSNIASRDGGAIALFDSARVVTAAGSAFDSNLAIGGVGGGVSVGSLCNVDLHGFVATRNAAVDGGALAASTLSTVRLKKSNLRANAATNTGGAILAENVDTMELEETTLFDNIAYITGGAGFIDTSPMVARNVVCFGNVALANGGALAAFASHIELEGVAFERNHAVEGSGGALYIVADSAVDITPVPGCARIILLVDWTQTSASCPPGVQGNDLVTCDFVANYCATGRDTMGEDACDGCACHDLGQNAENYFEVVGNEVLGTGMPRAKAITKYEFCLNPNVNASTYRLITYDSVRGRGWFSGKLHVAIASEHGWFPAVKDFSFDGKVGEVHFQVVQALVTTTRFVQNVAGGGGGALFHDVDLALPDFETGDNVAGNTAGYGDIWATAAVRLELELRNETVATSSAIPIQVTAKLLDAKGQLVATDSRLIVDVHWSADVDSVEAAGTRNTSVNGFVHFDALTFMAPVGTLCQMYLKSETLRSATINVSIMACPPGYEEELRNDITQCLPCRAHFYWRDGHCKACVDGMSCQDDGTIALEHRIVGDVGALALKSGYHRQSVYSHRPVRCDGGKRNRACPGGIGSVGCNTKKFVMNKPRCQVCETTYFRRGFRCVSCSQATNSAFITTKAILVLVLISAVAVLGPLVIRSRESHDVSLESEATIRFARAVRKVQTKYRALFVALQLWSILLFTAPVELPHVTVAFLDYIVILSVVTPGNCLTKRRFSLYSNLLVWTTGPFALVLTCVLINVVVNLVRSIKASPAAISRVEGHQQRPFVNLVYPNVFGGVRELASRMCRFSRDDSRLIFSRRMSDSQIALAVLVIVAFLYMAVSQSYPPMAYVVLSFFVTDTYDDPHKPNRTTSYSHFDPAVRAEGPTHIMYRIYAGICVATHVVGIPAFFAVCLHRVRDRLDPVDSEGHRARIDPEKSGESRARCRAIAHTRVDDPKLQALRPLWFGYLPQYFNFEVLELLRRMLMMTVPKLVSRRPATQMACTCLIAYASTRLYRRVQPFLSASDSEFFENIQWLTLILSSILLYIVADQRHDQFAGYAIILIFIISVIHATVLVAFDVRQEKLLMHAIKEYTTKLRDNFHGCCFLGPPRCPNSQSHIFKSTAQSTDDSIPGTTVKVIGDGEDDPTECDGSVTKPRSLSKVANAANDKAEHVTVETAKNFSQSG